MPTSLYVLKSFLFFSLINIFLLWEVLICVLRQPLAEKECFLSERTHRIPSSSNNLKY